MPRRNRFYRASMVRTRQGELDLWPAEAAEEDDMKWEIARLIARSDDEPVFASELGMDRRLRRKPRSCVRREARRLQLAETGTWR
jgi:hypothetical protein